MLVNPPASVCFLIQETGTHHSGGSKGIPRPLRHIHQCKERDSAKARATVCSILQRGLGRGVGGERDRLDGGEGEKKSFFECAEGTCCLALNEKSAVEKIQRGNFTPAY